MDDRTEVISTRILSPELFVESVGIRPFDYATMKDDVFALFESESARKWLGEPPSDFVLEAMGNKEYDLRGFCVFDTVSGHEECVGFVYTAPIGSKEIAAQVRSVDPDATVAISATVLKSETAPKGAISRGFQQVLNQIGSSYGISEGSSTHIAVVGLIHEDNERSRRFFDRAGFVDTGVSTLPHHEHDHMYVLGL